MKKESFEAEEKEILAPLPEELHSFFSNMAWERGHAFGYDEVLLILSIIIDDFMKCWIRYIAHQRRDQ